jgi:Bifunctional DNA primase/polymerase, N-terminal/AAA domain
MSGNAEGQAHDLAHQQSPDHEARHHPTSTQVDGPGALDAALVAQAQGQVPVPACSDPCTIAWHNQPCPGKRPLVKIKDRDSVTAEEIRRWWTRWPLANLAILTGARSDLVVIDLDDEPGEQALKRSEDVLGPLPATREVKTKRGRHLWFRHPGIKILTRKGDDFYPEGKEQPNAHGLDVRGDGGLVIAPPSPNREFVNDLEMVQLPENWTVALSTGTAAGVQLQGEGMAQALELIRTGGEPCDHLVQVLAKHPEPGKNRHQALIGAQHALVMLGREQHPGAGQALDQLQAGQDEREWIHALEGAVSIAMAEEPASTGCQYRVMELDMSDDLAQLGIEYANRAKDRAEEREKDPPDFYEQAVKKELERIIVRDAAQRRYGAMQAEQLPDPGLTPLADLLDEPDDDPAYRIDGLWPTGGNVILAAARKAGKTTMVGNLVRSLVDGDAFLGAPGPAHVNGFDVQQVDGMVAVLDLELDRRMLRRWLRDQGIGKSDHVMAESLRGRAHLFDVLDDTRRGRWAALLAQYGVQVLILDPFGALLDAMGRDENSNSDVGPVLQALDQLKVEAGIGELFIAHHFGHTNERSRGASKLRGWPDAEWFLVRERAKNGEEPPPDAARFFLAEGRDVMVPETRLEYSASTRRLTVAGGNRVQHQATKNGPMVLEIVESNPGQSQTTVVEAAMARGIAKHPAENALRTLVRDGQVRTEPGPKRATLHYPVQVQDQGNSSDDPFADSFKDLS